MEDFSHILLFKTNISSESCRDKLGAVLAAQAGVIQWNIALDDEDYVLRIVSYTLKHEEIIQLIHQQGYACSELK